MVFKKKFDTDRDAKRNALADLDISIQDENQRLTDIVEVRAVPIGAKTPMPPTTLNGWMEAPNTTALCLYIREKDTPKQDYANIQVERDANTKKWIAHIGLNPKSNKYHDALSRLLDNEWTEYDMPPRDSVTVDTPDRIPQTEIELERWIENLCTECLQNSGLPDDAIAEIGTGLSEQVKESMTDDITALIERKTPLSETDMETLENKIRQLLDQVIR